MIRELTKSNIEPQQFVIKQFTPNLYEITLNEDIESFNITTFEMGQETERIEYVYKTSVKTIEANNRNHLKGALIRLKYSIDEEFSFIYKDNLDTKFVEYRNYVESVKTFVDSLSLT